jgi:hypothetical protein
MYQSVKNILSRAIVIPLWRRFYPAFHLRALREGVFTARCIGMSAAAGAAGLLLEAPLQDRYEVKFHLFGLLLGLSLGLTEGLVRNELKLWRTSAAGAVFRPGLYRAGFVGTSFHGSDRDGRWHGLAARPQRR